MAAIEAVDLLINDNGDKEPASGFRKDFADDKPYRSFLQRIGNDGNGMELDEVLDIFDWTEDCDKWIDEYHKSGSDGPDMSKLVKYRRRVAFCIGGWRELNEDFGRGDVSCIRDLRTPCVTSRSPLKQAKREFDEDGQ